MKKYVRNKNFIPTRFIDKLDRTSNEKNNKLILLLLIVNIFILPSSISKIASELKSNEAISVANINNTYNDIYINSNNDNLVLILNSIDNIKKIKMENNRGFIEVFSIEEVYKIDEKKDFKIKSVDIKENTIAVEVELWKRNI